MTNPLDTQVAGDHYKNLAIQPMEFSVANKLDAVTHTIVKYAVRKKGDIDKQIEDCDKAIHCLEMKKQFLREGKL